MINSSYLDVDISLRKISGRWVDILVMLLASIVMGMAGQISIVLPFTPVPIGFQAHTILFLAVCLGSQRAVGAVALLLLQGALGLPVFTNGGCGLIRLLGPTGGYIFGYLIAAFVTGWLSERAKEKTPLYLFKSMAMGNLVIYGSGMAWLSQFLGWKSVIVCGLAPFVIGDLIKLVAATKLLKRSA
jgi:biotin transport system substrate-specific component